MTGSRGRDAGFSVIEVLIALTVFGVAVVPVLYVAAAGQRLARSQPEATDLHQRVRVATDKLRRDLAVAGAGPRHGSVARGLATFVAPIIPARSGLRAPDAELSAFADRVSLFYVPDEGWEARIVASMTSASEGLRVDPGAVGCPDAGFCGFDEGQRALIAESGRVGAGYELFTVTGIDGELAHQAPNLPFSRLYETGATVVPIVQRVYYLDRATRRLMLYDGFQSDMPLIDHVVDLRVEYFADASSTSVARPPVGESSCLYEAGAPPVPRLADLGGAGLRPLPLAQLIDGPACGVAPNRFDGDLLRVRLVRVTLRLEAAADDVRGSGAWFARPGHSTSAYSFVPDVEVTFEVAPRNLLPVAGVP